jgi:YD repeat-containing protein
MIGKFFERARPASLAVVSMSLLYIASSADAEKTIRYGYDALGRLTSAQDDGANASATNYQFDAASNRTKLSISAPARVLNGAFEDPVIESYQYNPSAPELSFVGLAGIAVNGDAWGFPAPWDGRQVAFVQSASGQTGSVELTASGLVPGRPYRFAFATSQRPGYPANSLRVYIDGNLVWDAAPASATQFTPYPTSLFVASSETSKIRFSSSPTSYDSSSAVDSVSIERLN